MRTAVKDMEMKGHFIPKGWCVYLYFRSVHLDKSHYDDPHRFNPWRWKVRVELSGQHLMSDQIQILEIAKAMLLY